jgi:hypothetical protein
VGLDSAEQQAAEEKRQAEIAADHEARRARLGQGQPDPGTPAAPSPGNHPDDVAEREAKTAKGIPDFRGNPQSAQKGDTPQDAGAGDALTGPAGFVEPAPEDVMPPSSQESSNDSTDSSSEDTSDSNFGTAE